VTPLGTELLAADRAAIAALWLQRARSESSVGCVFAQLADELAATGAHAEVVALARSATGDEARHAATCLALAAAYGAAATALDPVTVRLPDYTAEARLRATLHAVNLCCIGETIATAFVEACVGACDDGALRDLHGRHLADEIRHARVGWAHVATLDAPERAAVAGWLPQVLEVQLRAWERRIGELPEAGFPGHGYPPRAALLDTVRAAVRELVLPGFAHVAIDASAAAAWFAAQ
jgi:hypothetical protein